MAAGLKLVIPLIVVIPGIAAFVMVNDVNIMAGLGESRSAQNMPSTDQADKAYPWLLQFLPSGLKGLAFAALAAAIVSSLASMLNSHQLFSPWTCISNILSQMHRTNKR